LICVAFADSSGIALTCIVMIHCAALLYITLLCLCLPLLHVCLASLWADQVEAVPLLTDWPDRSESDAYCLDPSSLCLCLVCFALLCFTALQTGWASGGDENSRRGFRQTIACCRRALGLYEWPSYVPTMRRFALPFSRRSTLANRSCLMTPRKPRPPLRICLFHA
jgi:hypothetical protein